jgi:hypothetical protein
MGPRVLSPGRAIKLQHLTMTTSGDRSMAKVYASAVIPAQPSTIWAVVRDFNALPVWTPFVTESRIEHNRPSDQVGCIRHFRLKDSGRIREQLVELSDYEMSFGYTILESPMGVENYYAAFRLTPVTDADHLCGMGGGV